MKGTIVSISGSILFGGVYYLAAQLSPLTGLEVVGWRMLLLGIFLTLFLVMNKRWDEVESIYQRAKLDKKLWVALPLSSALVGVQLWLFVWSPQNNEALNTSLGFFLLPLALVCAGRICFKERLSSLQTIACLCATFGVLNQLWYMGSLSWTTTLAAFGFVPYFTLRRYLGIDNLGGLWFDSFLHLPFALCFILFGSGVGAFKIHPELLYLLPLFGGTSALALICCIWASRLLPLGLFGLLSYIEPTLLTLVSLVLGETIKQEEWVTYIGIWTGIFFLAMDGTLKMSQLRTFKKRMQQSTGE